MQRDLLLEQIAFFLRAAPDAQARQNYEALQAAVTQQSVPPELVPRLEAILEVSLSGDRLRRTLGPAAQLSLHELFQKTPRGQARAAEIGTLNRALARLRGGTLTEIGAAQRGPGAYALTIATTACRIVVRLDTDGVRVESLDVDLD